MGALIYLSDERVSVVVRSVRIPNPIAAARAEHARRNVNGRFMADDASGDRDVLLRAAVLPEGNHSERNKGIGVSHARPRVETGGGTSSSRPIVIQKSK